MNCDFNILTSSEGAEIKKKKKLLEVATIMTGIKRTNSGRYYREASALTHAFGN